VPAKERGKHLASFLSQRHRSEPAFGTALDTADKPLFVEGDRRRCCRSWIEVNLWANGIALETGGMLVGEEGTTPFDAQFVKP
jgi:hypothetical protein